MPSNDRCFRTYTAKYFSITTITMDKSINRFLWPFVVKWISNGSNWSLLKILWGWNYTLYCCKKYNSPVIATPIIAIVCGITRFDPIQKSRAGVTKLGYISHSWFPNHGWLDMDALISYCGAVSMWYSSYFQHVDSMCHHPVEAKLYSFSSLYSTWKLLHGHMIICTLIRDLWRDKYFHVVFHFILSVQTLTDSSKRSLAQELFISFCSSFFFPWT